jgi:hypothetical protein
MLDVVGHHGQHRAHEVKPKIAVVQGRKCDFLVCTRYFHSVQSCAFGSQFISFVRVEF